MSVKVLATTDQVPQLLEAIEQRHRDGLDRFDEWWEGVYRIVTGPSPEHGRLVLRLGSLLDDRSARRGLHAAAPINIGVDKWDARVPDLAVYRPDTVRTSPAFLATAELVVEVLSPGERAGEKLEFFASRHVREYLEIDLVAGTARLLAWRDGTWQPADASEVVELTLAEVVELVTNIG